MSQLSRLGIRLHYVFVNADITQPRDEAAPAVPPGYHARAVGLDEMLCFVDRVPDLSREFLERAFGHGDECVANFFEGELVGFGFVSRARTRVTAELEALIPDGFRYSYKAWTHPDHRRRNLSRLRSHVRLNTVARPYNERGISYIETHNYPSLLRGYRRPTLRRIPMGITGWFTLFGRQIPFNSRRAKWIGFEFVRRDDVRVRQYPR